MSIVGPNYDVPPPDPRQLTLLYTLGDDGWRYAICLMFCLMFGGVAMIRRLPLATPVRAIVNDDEMLRAVASCANEAVDALDLPGPHQAAALQRVAQRYGRLLDIGPRELRAALQDSGTLPQPPIAESSHAPLEMPVAPATPGGAALRGSVP